MDGLELDAIRHALAVAEERGFAEVEIGASESTFRAVMQPGRRKAAVSPAVPAAKATNGEADFKAIKSPIVGYYRLGTKELKAGDTVERGDVVAVINALGIANDVEAGVAGEIIEVLVKDGEAVQYGQILAKVKP